MTLEVHLLRCIRKYIHFKYIHLTKYNLDLTSYGIYIILTVLVLI